MRGSDADISHTIDDQGERVEYTEYINSALASDPDVSARLPIPTDNMQIFDECRDGIMICKLVEHFYPGTIDSVMGIRRRKGTTFINLPSGNHTLNKFQMAENNNIAILAAQEIGANMVNINAQDLMAGREHLILSLIGQIIRLGKSDKPRPPSRQRPITPSGKRPATPSLKRPTTPSAPLQRPTTPSAPLQRNRSATLPARPTRAPPSPPRSHRSMSMSLSVDDDDITRVASPLSAIRGETSAQKGINQSQLRSKLREKGTFRLFEDLKVSYCVQISPFSLLMSPSGRNHYS
jgi:Calponin homology (CH) domain